MPTNSDSPVLPPGRAAQAASSDPFDAIQTIARNAASHQRLITDMLRFVAHYFHSPYAAVHARYASEVVQDDCHFGPTDPAFWKGSVQEFLTDSLAESRPRCRVLRGKSDGTTIAFISTPLLDRGEVPIGALALVVGLERAVDADWYLVVLRGLLSHATLSFDLAHNRPRDAERGIGRSAGRVYESGEQFAFSLTNELRNRLGCEQVGLGLVTGLRVKLASLSGFDEVHKHGPGVKALQAAMEECLDAGEAVSWPRDADARDTTADRVPRLHKQWRSAAGGDCVASIPLRHAGSVVAILSIRRSGQPYSREELMRLGGQVEPVMPNLLLIQRASRSLWRHSADALRGLVANLTGPGRLGTKAGTTAAVLAALLLAFGSAEYRVTVPCTVTPSHLRHLSMPFDGVIASQSVVAGDQVIAGQVLCEIDTADLLRQRAEVLAQLRVAQLEQDRAMAADSVVEAQVAKANQIVIQAKLAILERRLEQAVVRAPYNGLVLAGDLRKRVGEAIPRGELLFQVAPSREWALELEVPQEAIDQVHADLTGVFAAHARPEGRREFRVTRVLPEATVRDRRNVFLVEAEMSGSGHGAGQAPEWLRPGMRGVASVRCGSRRLIWILTHRAVDFLRMHFWL